VRVAALYVAKGGIYDGRDDVDLWDQERDARLYPGPYPVVAHPPCKRWGRYWNGGPSANVPRLKGDDGGCFSSALHSVRLWGGVLEHPAHSSAWLWHGLREPVAGEGWRPADLHGFTCHVEQGHYGHRARKATWLYAVRCALPDLDWSEGASRTRLDPGYRDAEQARRARRSQRERRTGVRQLLSAEQRAATPPEFARIMLDMALSVNPAEARVPQSGVESLDLFEAAP